ncbi:alpha/beta fold hydrolase [Falsiroseomonas sp. HC035]|uniref:alpha/beta fold hydrolase n=1 Tax=Falsiroseomonas sp. HC035 TaxID=3390999 RepID=UPI003D3184F5
MDLSAIPGAEARHLRTNGITLHAILAGPAEGRLVLLLHGFPEFSWGWRRQIVALAAAGLRVLAPDLRGYNLSDKPAEVAAYGLDTVADDVLGLADALGRDRFAVVGHDWGAILAWHLASRNPGRLDRVAILNGPHPATLGRHMLRHPLQALRVGYIGAFQVPALPEAVLRAFDFAALRTAMRATASRGSFTAEGFAAYRAAWSQPGALRGMLNWYRALLRHRPAPTPGRIAVPLRIIWGDRDIALHRRLAEAGLALCDQGEAFHLPRATHWVQHDAPDEVNRLLLDFLAD